MCTVMQEYEEKARAEGRDEGRAEGRVEGRMRSLIEMLKNGGTDTELRKFLKASDEEIMKARAMLAGEV